MPSAFQSGYLCNSYLLPLLEDEPRSLPTFPQGFTTDEVSTTDESAQL